MYHEPSTPVDVAISNGNSQYMGWQLRDANGYTILSGGSQAGETWQDSTYYNYCLPISDSCATYELVLWDNAYNGWNSSLPATALITSASGDTLLYFEAGGSYFGYKYLSFIAAPTGCTDQ